MRYGFPLHRNLRPIFVSFHCNKRGLLTDEAIEYLRRYGPVGCRDWTTVDLLLSVDVPAFFSGCMTTTVNTVFPEPPEPPPRGRADRLRRLARRRSPDGAVTYAHSDAAVRRRPSSPTCTTRSSCSRPTAAEHRALVTSRLHCYLPVRSIGAEVDFQPKNRVRHPLRRPDRHRPTTSSTRSATASTASSSRSSRAILAGRPEDDVYALWRELCADEVAAAEERRHQGAPPRPISVDLTAARAKAVLGAPPADAVHCAVVTTEGSGPELSVLIASLLEHASRPLHVWVLALPGTGAVEKRLGPRFPAVTLSRIPLRGLGAGVTPEVETAARLLIADLLGEVDRLVVLPLPSVATADVAELAELDLGGHPLAAPTRPGSNDVSGFGVIHAAALRLGHRPDAAAELRRTAHARHAFDFDAFTHDVLVLDLARLRAERFGDRALGLVREYRLDDLEALHYLVGPDRAVLPERWAVVPTRMPAREAGLIYWADGVKPAQPELVPERERWRAYRAS